MGTHIGACKMAKIKKLKKKTWRLQSNYQAQGQVSSYCHVSWTSKEQEKIWVANMRMLWWMCGNTGKDNIQNECIEEDIH